MGNKNLQCLFIGERPKVYDDLLRTLGEFGLNIQAKFVGIDNKHTVKKQENKKHAGKKLVSRALKKQKMPSLIFISDEVPFSVELLSDLVWQYASDAIVVIVTEKTISTSLKTPFNNTQFSKLHFDVRDAKRTAATNLHLQYLIQAVQIKWQFRSCKRLLGVSEKRCQWLVDSSSEAIAFISRDLHLYSNSAYLGLFNINSIHELPSISVKELIIEDEHELFERFVKKQMRFQDLSRSLVVSLKKVNGRSFRANIQVIPSVFKGIKCLQLWVHPLNKFELNKMENDSQSSSKKQIEDLIPFESPNTDKVLVPKKVTTSSILRGIIKRKEATISAQKLVEMKTNEGRRNKKLLSHILSLKVPIAQRVGIDDLLFSSSVMHQKEKRLIFWDKVKLTRLLQILMKKKQLDVNLYVRISEASVIDKPFAEWFLPGLNRIGNKASHLTFLMPSELNQSQVQPFMKLVEGLRSSNCQIALDNFSVSKQSLRLLKHAKPDCVRLSLPWVKGIEGNAKRELALGSFIRQLESKNIKVIAPCGFSADMRRLFALSGVSFCQERTRKTA